METNLITVVGAALLTAVITGAGVLPFLFVEKISRWWLGVFNALAAGLMLAASHRLILEGSTLNAGRTLLGILDGLGLIVLANWMTGRQEEMNIADLAGADARKAFLLLGVMTAHSFAEGVGVGVSFGGEQKLGIFLTLSIAVHNIPACAGVL